MRGSLDEVAEMRKRVDGRRAQRLVEAPSLADDAKPEKRKEKRLERWWPKPDVIIHWYPYVGYLRSSSNFRPCASS